MTPKYEIYFKGIGEKVEEALSVAKIARLKGEDPSLDVEIPIANDMAGRIENLLEIPGIADRIRELEKEKGRAEMAL